MHTKTRTSRLMVTVIDFASALSRQIKALEDEIGQCLLERQAHSIRLTPVGDALSPDARDLLQQGGQAPDKRTCG